MPNPRWRPCPHTGCAPLVFKYYPPTFRHRVPFCLTSKLKSLSPWLESRLSSIETCSTDYNLFKQFLADDEISSNKRTRHEDNFHAPNLQYVPAKNIDTTPYASTKAKSHQVVIAKRHSAYPYTNRLVVWLAGRYLHEKVMLPRIQVSNTRGVRVRTPEYKPKQKSKKQT